MIAAGRLSRGVLVAPGFRRYSRQKIEGAIRALFALAMMWHSVHQSYGSRHRRW
jgi:hypothetical protein